MKKTKKILNGKLVDVTQADLDEQASLAPDRLKYNTKMSRNKRNMLLTLSDKTMLSDYPHANKLEWVTYRQALRDVPTQTGFPSNIIWPTAPTR